MDYIHCKRQKPKDPNNYVYVGRPSKWGNPFEIGKDGDRDTVIRKYKEWIITQPHLMSSLHELKGKTLGCWCFPAKCHACILIDLCNNLKD